MFLSRVKDEKGTTIINAFQKILDESNRKPKKIWVEKGSESYNESMKSFLQNNNIETCLTHNEEKSVFAERFIINLKNEIYKEMISISKDVYIDKLDQIVTKYASSYHVKIKMKPFDANSSMHVEFNRDNNR